MSSESFDVVIIGGGPAGAAAAITLGQHHFRTAIIERSDYCLPRVGETLPPVIRNILTSLDVWQSFLAHRHVESYAIRFAWGGPEPLERNHIYNPYGSGWHVDRACFDRMLAARAANLGSILLTKAHIKHVSKDHGSGWQVEVMQHDQSRRIHAPFLINATGRTSLNYTWLPRRSNIVDHLLSIVCIYPLVAEPYTLIEAEPLGWWYSAPLPRRRLIVAHMTDADLLASDGCNVSEYWRRHLSEARLTHARTGHQRSEPIQLKVVPACSLIRSPVYGPDWLAAGDSCMAFDPLSGHGVYNALKGGILSAEAIIARFEGKSESLFEYARWVNSQFLGYLQTRRVIYSKEQRWPQSTFWHRRHD